MPTKALTFLPIGLIRSRYMALAKIIALVLLLLGIDYQRQQATLRLEQSQLQSTGQELLLIVQNALQFASIKTSSDAFLADQIPLLLPNSLALKQVTVYRQDGTFFQTGRGNPAQNFLVTTDDADHAAPPEVATALPQWRYYFLSQDPQPPNFWPADNGAVWLTVLLARREPQPPLLVELKLPAAVIIERSQIRHSQLASLVANAADPGSWQVSSLWTLPWGSLAMVLMLTLCWLWFQQRRAQYFLPTRAEINQFQQIMSRELNIVTLQTSPDGKVFWVRGRAPAQLAFLHIDTGDSLAERFSTNPKYLRYWQRALKGEKLTFEISEFDYHLRVYLWPVVTERNILKGVNVVLQDVSELQQIEWQMRQQQLHDTTTALPNRQYLSEQLNHDLQTSERRNEKLAVLAIELNGLSYILEGSDEAAFNDYLRQLVYCWQHVLDKEQTLARVSFNEFMVVIYNYSTEQELNIISERLIQAVLKVAQPNEQSIAVKVNIGLSTYPHDALDANSLLSNALLSKGHASQQGTNLSVFYSQDSKRADIEKWQLEKKLANAFNISAFALYYQPIFDVATNQCIAAEALIRWPSTHLRPDQFIPLAEECGLIHPIGVWTLETALRDFCQWKQQYNIRYISVNISAKQVKYTGFFRELDALLERYPIARDELLLEITESAMMQNEQITLENLNKLRARGIQLAIDDFGTGYASLNYLKSLPVSTVKIDHSFIPISSDDQHNIAICDAIIQLAQALKMKLIAEGVETPDQLDWLASRGVNIAQGYYYSKAIKNEEFQNFLSMK